jgi:hypothetical protein
MELRMRTDAVQAVAVVTALALFSCSAGSASDPLHRQVAAGGTTTSTGASGGAPPAAAGGAGALGAAQPLLAGAASSQGGATGTAGGAAPAAATGGSAVSSSGAASGGTASGGGSTSGGGTTSAGGSTSGGGTAAGASALGGSTASADTPSASTSGLFNINLSLSSAIATVGIVEWSIDAAIDSAYVGLGREPGSYEFTAPVDLNEPDYRTLLLGMKPSTTYYVQVVAQGSSGTHTSDVYPIETGFLPNGLPVLSVDDRNAAALYGGFTVNCSGVSSGGFGDVGGGDSWAFIFDKDGDYVWAYDLTDTVASGCSRARMSFDGKHMWAGNFSNVSPDGALLRVTMDGLSEAQTYSLPGRHHDFTVLPNNNVLFYEQENGGGYSDGAEGADIIKELDPETGVTSQIYHENTDFAEQIAESGAHTNYIAWVPHLNAISFSLRHTSTIGLISYPAGELLAVFGGPISDFDISWDTQHGHAVLEDTLLVFNNNGSNGGSSVLEYQYDLTSHSATKVFDYSSGNTSMAFGDVQRLPNGNTLVTYSSTGVIREINSAGELLREITTDAIGYSVHRKTLYGPPPPVGE